MRLAVALAAPLAAVVPLAIAIALGACSTLTEDPPAPYDANPLGNGQRIADIQSPSSQAHQQALSNANGTNVDVTSVVVSWIDTFDETRDGKSKGTVYIQDVGSTAPYAGISLYQPNYVPASLRPQPGDVLDVTGPYQELKNIGTAIFGNTPDGKTPLTLPQLAKPVGQFRYEFRSPDPVTIQLSDLDQATYLKGRQWEGMLVTVNDVTISGPTPAPPSPTTRVTYFIGQGDGGGITLTSPEISNELYDLKNTDFPAGTHFKSVTGIVTWFYSYHIAPRSADDLVVAQ
jgi:hypothetical protein